MFKVGTLADWFKVGVLEGIKLSNEVGAQGVQLYAWDNLHPDNVNEAFLEEVREVAAKNDQEIVALCGELGGHGFEIKADNLKKIAYIKGVIDIAVALDCKVVTTHVGRIPEDKNSERYHNLKAACYEVSEYAAKYNVMVAIETGPEKITTLVSFIQDCDSKGLGINYDPANLVMVTQDDEVQGVYTGKDYIVHTHAKDGVFKKYLGTEAAYEIFATGGIEALSSLPDYFLETPLGAGEVRWVEYLNALKEIGYDGYLTIEREVNENAKADIILAVDFLKNTLEKL